MVEAERFLVRQDKTVCNLTEPAIVKQQTVIVHGIKLKEEGGVGVRHLICVRCNLVVRTVWKGWHICLRYCTKSSTIRIKLG